MRLFELPPLEPDEDASHAHRHSALGTAAELLLTSRLIELGHRVAVPVVDDDGVDLVVNYHCKVQVKSSACRTATGSIWINLSTLRSSERGQRRNWIRPHIDIVAVYARDTRAWWLVQSDTHCADSMRRGGGL